MRYKRAIRIDAKHIGKIMGALAQGLVRKIRETLCNIPESGHTGIEILAQPVGEYGDGIDRCNDLALFAQGRQIRLKLGFKFCHGSAPWLQ